MSKNKVRTTEILIPVEADGSETYDAIKCPVCQMGYVHLVSIKRVGYDHMQSFNGLNTVSEGSTILCFACEAGHNFDLIFAEHRGAIFTSAMRKADTASILLNRNIDTLTTTLQAVESPSSLPTMDSQPTPNAPIATPSGSGVNTQAPKSPNGASSSASTAAATPVVRQTITNSRSRPTGPQDSVHGNM